MKRWSESRVVGGGKVMKTSKRRSKNKSPDEDSDDKESLGGDINDDINSCIIVVAP